MVTAVVTIQKVDTGEKFLFVEGEVKTESILSSMYSMQLQNPQNSPYSDQGSAFNINLGVQKTLELDWTIYPIVGVSYDRSQLTHSPAVMTNEQILNYLEDTICFPGIGEGQYQITVTDKFRTRTAIYTLSDWKVDTDSGIYPTGYLKFNWVRQVA